MKFNFNALDLHIPDFKFNNTESKTKNLLNGLSSQKTGNDVINFLINLIKQARNLSGCLAGINIASRYLGHEDKTIREVAACVIVALIEKAVPFLAQEKDPEAIKNAIGIMSKAIDKISDLKLEGKINSISDFNLASLKDDLFRIKEAHDLYLENKSNLKRNRAGDHQNTDLFVLHNDEDLSLSTRHVKRKKSNISEPLQ